LESDTFEEFLAKIVNPYKYDKSRKASEGKYVAKTDAEIAEEIAKIPKSVRDKREKVWNDARKTGMGGTSAAPTAPTPTAPTKAPAAAPAPASGNQDWLDKQLKGL
jgi:hypothetical protein